MTVGELKEKMPLADVIEIRPEAKYILKLPKGCTKEHAIQAQERLVQSGIGNFIIITGNVTIYDIEP